MTREEVDVLETGTLLLMENPNLDDKEFVRALRLQHRGLTVCEGLRVWESCRRG